jgi:uncharacterized membrane protein HdeD (DUF308 family)
VVLPEKWEFLIIPLGLLLYFVALFSAIILVLNIAYDRISGVQTDAAFFSKKSRRGRWLAISVICALFGLLFMIE